jgi:hypothetical protein
MSLRLVHRDLVNLIFQIDLRSGMHKLSKSVVATLNVRVTEMGPEANSVNADPQILGATVQNLLARVSWQPEFVQLCLRLA